MSSYNVKMYFVYDLNLLGLSVRMLSGVVCSKSVRCFAVFVFVVGFSGMFVYREAFKFCIFHPLYWRA